MKCFVGVVLPKEPADILWTMQTRTGQILASKYGDVPISQGKSPLNIRVAGPFEAEGFGGIARVQSILREVSENFDSFQALVQGVDTNGASDIYAMVFSEEALELRARIHTCLGVRSPADTALRIRIAHGLNDHVYDAVEGAFSRAHNEQRSRGTIPLPVDVTSFQLFAYGPREWERHTEFSLRP